MQGFLCGPDGESFPVESWVKSLDIFVMTMPRRPSLKKLAFESGISRTRHFSLTPKSLPLFWCFGAASLCRNPNVSI